MAHRKSHPEKARPNLAEKLSGKGGSREGYVAKNEIEDMTLFDEDPGKSPSQEEGKRTKKAKEAEDAID